MPGIVLGRGDLERERKVYCMMPDRGRQIIKRSKMQHIQRQKCMKSEKKKVSQINEQTPQNS